MPPRPTYAQWLSHRNPAPSAKWKTEREIMYAVSFCPNPPLSEMNPFAQMQFRDGSRFGMRNGMVDPISSTFSKAFKGDRNLVVINVYRQHGTVVSGKAAFSVVVIVPHLILTTGVAVKLNVIIRSSVVGIHLDRSRMEPEDSCQSNMPGWMKGYKSRRWLDSNRRHRRTGCSTTKTRLIR